MTRNTENSLSSENDAPMLPLDQAEEFAGLVVGIGASAGGLESLEGLLTHTVPCSDVTYVIIQHLSPDSCSVMDQLLARHTTIPVKLIHDQEPLLGNRIYLLPQVKRSFFLTVTSILPTERSMTS